MLVAIAASGLSSSAQEAPFAITPSDVAQAPGTDTAEPFSITSSDVAATSGRQLVYQGTESAGDAAITNNEGDSVDFVDHSTAAQATIVNNSGGTASFSDHASAGSAFMTNNSGSSISFSGEATAAGANITNNGGGTITFSDTSDAGNAAVANNGDISFRDSTSANQANIVNNAGANVTFTDQANGGTGQITNNGAVAFSGDASAGQMLLINNEGATLDFSGNSTADAAAVTNNGQLGFADSATAGTSSIVNNESGVVVFSGTSTAGSSFSANSGKTSFEGNSTAGSAEIVNNATGTVALSGNATLGSASVNNGGDVVFSGNASAGSASIVTGPEGRTIFTGNSDGGTAALEADAGAVVDFSGVTDGAISIGSIKGPGTFYLGGVVLSVGGNNLSTTVDGAIVDGGISGGKGGALTKVGTGTLTLSGANTYTGATTVKNGVLQAGAANTFSAASAVTIDSGAKLDLAGFDQSIGSLSGAGTVDLATARLTTGVNGKDSSFSGSIGGTGGLTKTGAGTQELTGVSTYSGLTEIEAGILKVNGSIAQSSVLVDSDGTLSGHGTVGSTTVAGTLSRQNDGGTLAVQGDLSFSQGGVYSVKVDSTPSAALVTVAGTATLTGGSLIVSPIGGFSLEGTTFHILSATEVVGTFDTVTTSMPFIDLGVIYSGTGVDLNVARNGKAFASSARTDNQRAVADAVEGLGSGMIYDAVVASASDAAARASFDSLSGEIYPSLATAGIETDTMLRGILIERALEQPADVGGNGLWGRPYRLNATLLSNGNAADVNQRTWGVIGGADGDIDDIWKLGVAAGYGRSNIDVPDRASSAKIDTLSLAAYASWEAARWRGAFGALYSWHDISANRFVTAGTFEDATDVNYRARSGQIFGQVDYRVAISNWILDPFLNVAYARWDADGFSEHGGDAALTARSSSVDGLVGTAGLRVGTEVALDHGVAARLGATAGWRLSSIGDSETLMSIAGSDPFFIGGVPVERSVAVLGLEAGLVYRNTSFGLAYTGLLGSRTRQHTIQGALSIRF